MHFLWPSFQCGHFKLIWLFVKKLQCGLCLALWSWTPGIDYDLDYDPGHPVYTIRTGFISWLRIWHFKGILEEKKLKPNFRKIRPIKSRKKWWIIQSGRTIQYTLYDSYDLSLFSRFDWSNFLSRLSRPNNNLNGRTLKNI